MNKALLEKLLKKVSLGDLYSEVEQSDAIITKLGIALMNKKPSVFVGLIRTFIRSCISGDTDTSLLDFFKSEIINMDGVEDLSVNKTVKRKVATSVAPISASVNGGRSSSVSSDPCSRGGGRGSSC